MSEPKPLELAQTDAPPFGWYAGYVGTATQQPEFDLLEGTQTLTVVHSASILINGVKLFEKDPLNPEIE